MKIATTVKTLTLMGLTSLALVAGTSQADNNSPYFGGNQNANPWLAGQAHQQMNYQMAFRARVDQLDQRQDAQLQRILGGMEQGKLTLREASGLIREHLAISNLERRYMADGRLGPNELNDLERRLEEANRHIQFEKNDREQAGQPGRPGDGYRR
ncbi:MAG: hypothetical protein PHR30_08215 [Gallionellaceae bacterium]|nr:hypothetical protein [Gallionellaceae bacterium]MDD5365310.1 hypothetical protein [Gallionellaceae bacterium]